MQGNVTIQNTKYMLSVTLPAGTNSFSYVKLEAGDKSVSYNGGLPDSLQGEGTFFDAAKAAFQSLSQGSFKNFPENMPATIKLRFDNDNKDYPLQRKILRSQV